MDSDPRHLAWEAASPCIRAYPFRTRSIRRGVRERHGAERNGGPQRDPRAVAMLCDAFDASVEISEGSGAANALLRG